MKFIIIININPEYIQDYFMDKQEYFKSSVTSNDAKKYSFGFQRKNHLVCQNKWSLIYMLQIVFEGNKETTFIRFKVLNNIRMFSIKYNLQKGRNPEETLWSSYVWTQKEIRRLLKRFIRANP